MIRIGAKINQETVEPPEYDPELPSTNKDILSNEYFKTDYRADVTELSKKVYRES